MSYPTSKRSAQVSLVLLGSITLVGCERSNTFEYQSQQDCEKDWGEQDCEERGRYRAGGAFFFIGAANRYRADQATNARRIERGGFGSRFSAGRS